ncbi:Gmad2 immunoglobulin-like domain-containing protein [Micromonospora mirobrigensis]|uniref:Sporulation and spore germination n=1 Tax=Micromonospora mirobrigensis TaxID=262898 RepID=A0A1C4WD64_9ACTN|nr:Gmad2 immunoglobulin-like domain-containing protein [Micromonospora mirobrigensis]SCE94130.1 Sporulation and spore germination [Micromonospora mirobrigensis]
MNRTCAALLVAALLLTGCADDRTGTLGPAPTLPVPASTTGPAAPATPTAPIATGTSAAGPVRSGPATAGPTPVGPVPASTAPTGAAPAGTVTVQLWLVRDGRLAPVTRTRPQTPATSALALDELAAGPSAAEASTALTTLVPEGVRMVRISGGTATVAAPPALTDGPAGTVRLRRAQLVWTLTQFPAVRRVDLGDGRGPTSRADYADLLPPIVVTGPAIGQRVGSPVTVTGSAQVFEATVSVRVLDRDRHVIGAGFTTATCGTGCRGDYRVAVRYRLAATGQGTVEVYEVSARDGSRINVVAVPVVLASAE